MPRRKREFIQLDIRLFNDPRFFMLDEFDQLTYIKLIALAKQTNNKIPKKWSTLKECLRSKRPTRDIQESVKRVTTSFRERDKRGNRENDTICQNRYNLWFSKYNERYLLGYLDKDIDKDIDKEINYPLNKFYKDGKDIIKSKIESK